MVVASSGSLSAQRIRDWIDGYGIALHAGMLPGHPASHGCIRLPAKFAAKLYQVTEVGTPVLIGA